MAKDRSGFSLREGLTPRMRWTFLSALLFGLFSHGMGLFNKYSWHDDMLSLFGEGATIPSGRWMIHVMGWLVKLFFGTGSVSLPVINGLFSLLCIGAAACMLVWLLDIRKRICCAGLGCVMAAFPTVAGLFGYMFTIPYYMMAMGMMVAAGCLICGGKRWWMKIAAVFLGGCAMGTYQAFLPMLLSAMLIYDMTRLAEGEESIRDFLKLAGVQVLCVLGIMGFYFAMNRFFLQKFGMQANDYIGMDQLGAVSMGEYFSRAGTAYREFLSPARYVSADMYPMRAHYTYLAMLCGDLGLGIWQGVRLWRRNRGKTVLFFLLMALFPLANDFIYVMSDWVHGLMTYSLVMQMALFAWLADRADFQAVCRNERRGMLLRRAVSGVTALLLGGTAVIYARFDNQCYLKAEFQQQEAISFLTALTAQIKAVPGFREEMPVVFLNEGEISDQTLYHMDELDFIHLDPYGATLEEYLNSYTWRLFMARWCGFAPAWADAADYEELPEVQEMPHYPDDGSIRNLGDVIIVNF